MSAVAEEQYSCACPENLTLAQNQRDCVAISKSLNNCKSLIYSHEVWCYGFKVNRCDGIYWPVIFKENFPHSTHIICHAKCSKTLDRGSIHFSLVTAGPAKENAAVQEINIIMCMFYLSSSDRVWATLIVCCFHFAAYSW